MLSVPVPAGGDDDDHDVLAGILSPFYLSIVEILIYANRYQARMPKTRIKYYYY